MGKKKLTTEEFIERAKQVHGDKYDYSKVEYVNNHTKICIICPEHGEFWQTPTNHLQGKRCIYCSKRFKKDTKYFINECVALYGDKYDYSDVEYIGAHNKVKIKCKACNTIFNMTPAHHLSGEECPNCSLKMQHDSQRKTTDEFIKEAIKVHGNKYDYSKTNYVSYHNKLVIICKEHGEFLQAPAEHLRGNGCPKCNESQGESRIQKILDEYNIKYVVQKKFDDCKNKRALPFDFYLPDYNLCIEYQGDQHYKSVKHFGGDNGYSLRLKNDEIKRIWCSKKENPSLLEISNKDFNNIEKILIEELNL